MAAPLICPSILASDFARLGEEVRALETAGADWIHVDVMDGHFVPNLTMGPDIVKAIRPHSALPFDVHLMVAPVDPWLEAYRDAGADILTVHPESGPHLHRTLGRIRQLGAKAGVVLNPGTPLNVLEEVVDLVDLVLLMSVNPGFGGQSFIPSSLRKIERARALLDAAGSKAHLQVDGGVTAANAAACVAAGADALVAGSFVFKGGADAYAANIRALKAA
ncbi:ribulose-phosphate 3-epimerase [Brevundimonas viscosa]|uniref:Ribulose-phosphate 3-epimerase n=1 Tax=Brevundimonas viscosa TaxID=871741 RepID=A0A1I6P0R7_9CAUL|nr:ribulose-phosphate 3-epimerase [Brevundimonas viscosa]SFS33670.1 ribulose-5-phosphate 3-epimerase [Brevundimonas viscosa]